MRARKAVPPNQGKRVNGYLWCRVCERSWAFNGTAEGPWPTHRCGREIAPFNQFLLEDPLHKALPVWKEEVKR